MKKDNNNLKLVEFSPVKAVKYNKQTVLDYIVGNEIDDIEKLENDSNFMLDVIKITKDKNMYKLCSDNLKNNSEFIINLMNLFKDDKEFCFGLANEYLIKDLPLQDQVPVAVAAKVIDNGAHDDNYLPIGLFLTFDYSMFKILTEDNKDPNSLSGFYTFLALYNDNDDVKKYYAERMVNDILTKEMDVDLESYVKSKFNTPDYIIERGEDNYILDIIESYDAALRDYLEFHRELINPVVINLIAIVNNWDEEVENQKAEILQNLVSEFSLSYPELSTKKLTDFAEKEFNVKLALDIEDLYSCLPSDDLYSDLLADEELYEIDSDADEYYCFELDEIETQKLLLKFKKEALVALANYKQEKDPYIKNNKVLKFQKDIK